MDDDGATLACELALIREAKLISDALARANIEHRFEIYDDRDEIGGYLHHEWPCGDDA
jgi:hypothetical protein